MFYSLCTVASILLVLESLAQAQVPLGTGLGLAVAHNLIKKSGGTINISSNTNEGTSVIITLPLATEEIGSGQGLKV